MIFPAVRSAVRYAFLGAQGDAPVPPPVDELQTLLNEISQNATPRACLIPEPGILGNQKLWRLSDGTNAVTASGDPVGRADVVSSDSNDFIQAVSTDRPQYRLTSGMHSLYGDGLQTRMVSEAAVPWLTDNTAEAFFAVSYKREVGSGYGYVVHCDKNESGQSNMSFAVLSNFGGEDRFIVGGSLFSVPATAQPVVVYVQFNKNTGQGVISWNGGEETAITIGGRQQTDAPMRILARGGGVHFQGQYYGNISAQGVVPFSTRRNVMQYLAERSGVTL